MKKKSLYAIPTWNCNLNCPHCFIKDKSEIFNRDKFIEELNKFDGRISLFGGEVTSNLDRMFDIINSNKENGVSKISGITTNLIILNNNLINLYKEFGSIGTSWNPNRFNHNEYEIWLKNCKIISDNGIKYTILITLTDDLFSIPIKEFIDMVKTWDTDNLKQLKFEHYVGKEATPEYFKKADKWLCELYKIWDTNINLEIENRVCHWNYDCDNIYTLLPDGSLTNQCPHMSKKYVPSECYICDRVEKCRPCRLQKYCSYPREFANMVINNKGL